MQDRASAKSFLLIFHFLLIILVPGRDHFWKRYRKRFQPLWHHNNNILPRLQGEIYRFAQLWRSAKKWQSVFVESIQKDAPHTS